MKYTKERKAGGASKLSLCFTDLSKFVDVWKRVLNRWKGNKQSY